MIKRLFRYIRALLSGKLDQLEDPDIILTDSIREMKEVQIRNRERAVQAITQKNNLRNMVDREEKLVSQLSRKAEVAVQGGNRELARQLIREKNIHEGTLESLRASLKQAEETSEAVKVAIQREEENIRIKTAKALELKTQWKQAQITNAINKSLEGFKFEEAGQNFERAEEKIRNMQAEADARSEIAKTSIDSKIAELQTQEVDMETERELQEMEARMGLAAASTNNTQTSTQVAGSAQEDDIDRQLRELEQKLNRG